jgi:CHAT domain-containing protein
MEVAGNRSFLALAGGDRLTARDVNSWGIADGSIAVLSACQTGLGAARSPGPAQVGVVRALQRGAYLTVRRRAGYAPTEADKMADSSAGPSNGL